MATVNDARGSGTVNQTGTISVGKTADLVLVKNNPLNDLKTLRKPIGVMMRGRWLDRTILQSFASP